MQCQASICIVCLAMWTQYFLEYIAYRLNMNSPVTELVIISYLLVGKNCSDHLYIPIWFLYFHVCSDEEENGIHTLKHKLL